MMHAAISSHQLWGRWRTTQRLVMVEAFEDSATGTRIKEFRQGLSRQLGEGCQLIEHVWLFNMFRLPELQEIAAEEAAAADLIVISVHAAEDLPDEARGWLDRWVEGGVSRDAVMLVMQDAPAGEEAGPVEEYLREAARRGGMEFVLETRALAE